MVCTVRGKLSYFCMGRAQSIQCAVTQYSRAVGCHHMCLVLTNLVNPPIKPDVGYPVGTVTKNWFCCQQNQPFKEDVCCCLTFRLRHLNSVFRAHGTKYFCDSPLNRCACLTINVYKRSIKVD